MNGGEPDHGFDTMIAHNDGIAVYKSNYADTNSVPEEEKHKTLHIDRKHLDNLFKTELDAFNEMEVQNGTAGATRTQHRAMVYSCLAVLETKNTHIRLDRISKADLDFIKAELEYYGKNSPASEVKVFAAFLSCATGRAPLISLGAYGKQTRTDALITGKILVGTKADRKHLDNRFKAELDSFSRMEESNGISSHTRSIHRSRVIGCLYLLENRDIATLDSSDIGYLENRLADIGVEVGRYIKPFVSFVAHITGKEPLKDVGQPKARPKWYDMYAGTFRYPTELDAYRGYITARGIGQGSIDIKISRVVTAMKVLDAKYPNITIPEISPHILSELQHELKNVTSERNALNHIRDLSDFVSYFGQRDVYARMVKARRDPITFIPETEEDREFESRLREYHAFLESWDYKERTIKNRISADITCYKKLKMFLGERNLADVKPNDFRYLRDMFNGYEEGTVRGYLYEFGHFLEFVTGHDPYPDARIRWNGVEPTRQFIFDDEWVQMYRSSNVTQRLIIGLGATMGLRKKEIVSISLDDITETKIYVHGKGTGADGKGQYVEMSDLVKEDLAEFMGHRREFLGRFGDRTGGQLFFNEHPGYAGKGLTERAFYTILDDIVEKSGVPFSTHCLRRYFCTTMADGNVDIHTISKLMRHSSVTTTERCYLHADPRKQRAAIDSVNNTFRRLKAGI